MDPITIRPFGPPPIRWVFWDLGDTLLNEDPLRYHIYVLLLEALRRAGCKIAFADLLKWRKQQIAQGDTKAHYTIAERELSPREHRRWIADVRQYVRGEWQRGVRLVPGALEALEHVRTRYRMGIIADQPQETMDALGRLGIDGFFDVVALNAAVGYDKPDERLFRWALAEAGCDAPDAAMIGNRLDVDIAPARSIGMKTIWCACPPWEKGWNPKSKDARSYLDAISRTPNWSSRPDETNRPDATVGKLALIPPALSTWGVAAV